MLVEYDKVLVLDLDIVVLQPLDDLFNLPAPAALARGANDKQHGEKLDGRNFFAVENRKRHRGWNGAQDQESMEALCCFRQTNVSTSKLSLR